MADAGDSDNFYNLIYIVDHPVISDSDTVERVGPTELFASLWEGGVG